MKTIKSDTLFELKNVSQPLVHKDTIFYLETRTDKEKNAYLTSLWGLHKETKERTLWVDEEMNPSQPAVSPNGKWLSFVSGTKDKKPQLYLMPLTGGGASSLTDEKEGISSYEWTSNGASIYYQTTKKPEKETDEETKKESGEASLNIKPVKITKLQYKMDGQGVTERERTFAVKKVDVATKHTSTILEKDRAFRLQYVSKDESVLFYVDKLDPENEWVYGASVYEYDVATKTSRLITADIPKGSFSFEAANEDETLFLFAGNDFSYAFVTLTALYVWNKNQRTFSRVSAEDKQVGDTTIGDFQQKVKGFPVKWVSSDSFIYPVSDQGKTVIYKGDSKGNNDVLVDKLIHFTDGDVIDDQTSIVTYSDLKTPSVLAQLDLKTEELKPLYNPNEAFEKEYQIADVERFWYKGAGDWDIQGWYVKPVEPVKSHPAIVYIHGGPQVNYGETFFHEMQQLASEGYGVIMLNPRGGNSYGQEFVASILGDYGNKDYQDIMLGTDYVLEKYPEIDSERVYVAGGSYGGFMTNWIVGHTDRFKAAVTQRSISNWISFYGTSDVGAFFVEFQLQRDISQANELWELSPLAHVQGAKTPILIIHGEEDLRCPIEQGEQMYTAMKKQGVDTKFVVYPKSSHGLSREGLPHLRMERLEEIKAWFKAYN